MQAGYLQREAVPGDRRRVKLLLTEKSINVVEQGRAVQQSYREILTAHIAPSDMEAFGRCMDTMRQNIEAAKRTGTKIKLTEKGDKKR